MNPIGEQTDDVLAVWTTCPDAATARRIAAIVVEERLAACANIVPGLTSIYRWEGAVQTTEECLLILKTAADGWSALEERLVEIHPYDVPELIAFPVGRGGQAYLRWVVEESGGGA